MLLSESHTSPPCPAGYALVDTQFSTSISNPITLPPSNISNLGWGGYLKPLRTSGMWTRSQLFWYIHRKELMAIFLSLKFFLKSQENVHVQIMTNNSTSVSYLNRMGGDKISHSFKSAIRHLEMVPRESYLHFSSTCCRSILLLSTVKDRVDDMQENIPTDRGSLRIDLFSSSQNHQLKTYCSWIADPKALKINTFTLSWDFNLVHVSSISSDSQMPFKDK